MFHIVISDTHSPRCINKSYEYTKTIISRFPFIDTVVLNGDILTSTSMTGSNLHKKGLSNKEKKEYLEQGAPNFFKKWKNEGKISSDMVIEYINERYNWLYSVIKNFSQLKRTIFNLGNHESEHQLLIFGELSLLTNSDKDDIPRVSTLAAKEIVKKFEKKLYELEKINNFHYIRNKHLIIDDTLILGIPGISHAATGPDAREQEEQTKFLINRINNLDKVSKIIIYNHTLGDYNDDTGKFNAASPSLKKFMESLPENIKTKIFVQSHNHWSYTQFMQHSDFHFVVNNAGLHNGIFNLIEFSNDVTVYDVDPHFDKVSKVKLNTNFPIHKEKEEMVARYYDDVEFILNRGDGIFTNNSNNIDSIKKSIFGKV
jgi:hypothetical protein